MKKNQGTFAAKCDKKRGIKWFSWIVAATAGSMAIQTAALASDEAANYPDRPVKVIVPVSPGGSTDTISRIVADKLREKWGQAVIVENMPGAGGTIGATRGAKAAPDGYTLVAHGDAVVLNPMIRKNLNYALDDFIGINRFVVNPQILVVNPNFAPKTLQEYVAYAKESPEGIKLAVPTPGGIGHLTHAMLEKEAGITVTHIPYKGGGPAAVDTLGGHTDALIITLAAVAEYIKHGTLVPLAVSTPYRSPQFPDVPTMAESGYPNAVVESWQGLLAPKGTPDAILQKIHRDINDVMNDPEVREKSEALGFRVAPMASTKEFNQWIQDESKKHGQTIQDAGLAAK